MRTELRVTVQKSVLLKKLESNRAKHLLNYEKAKTGYNKLLRRELETKIRVLDGPDAGIPYGKIKGVTKEKDLARIVNQKPQHYLGYYDQAIEMLKFGEDTTVVLDAQQYQNYIRDDWDWSQSFTTSNTAYVAAVR